MRTVSGVWEIDHPVGYRTTTPSRVISARAVSAGAVWVGCSPLSPSVAATGTAAMNIEKTISSLS